jgi:NAD(P)-dependent dehydrogenase (short-subunit alcohol dehydrogenase family)
MPTILITGAASGLGAAFVEAYATQQPSTKILALDRTPTTPNPNRPNVHPYTLDLTNESAVLALAQTIPTTEPLDLIIHSAGIRGLVPAPEDQYPNDVAACETLAGMDLETMTRTFQIYSVATFSLIRALLPNLLLCCEAGLANQQPPPKVIVMSSRMGSLSNNARPNPSAGSAYAYRASKAALNMIVRSFAVDVPGVVFVLCHPGRVETGLVRGREEGAIEAAESVAELVPLVERWGRDDSGRFYDRFGDVIEW